MIYNTGPFEPGLPIGGTVHPPEHGPGQETPLPVLGNGLRHVWVGSSGPSNAEQSLEGPRPHVSTFLDPCGKRCGRSRARAGPSRGPLKHEAPFSLFEGKHCL